MPLNQHRFFIAHRRRSYSSPCVRWLQPPRQKMPHQRIPIRTLIDTAAPFLVEGSIRSIRCTLQDQFAIRCQPGPQACQRRRSISRPAAYLAAMQVLQAQSPPRSHIASARDAVLAIELRKDHLSHIRSTPYQRSLPQVLRKLIPHPLHDPKDRLCRFARMRYLKSKCPRPADRSQEKPPRHPRRNAHLPSLEHNILSSPSLFKPSLSRIGYQRLHTPIAIANPQPICCGPYRQGRLVFHLARDLQQALRIILHVSSHPADRPSTRRVIMESRRLFP